MPKKCSKNAVAKPETILIGSQSIDIESEFSIFSNTLYANI